MNKAVFRQKNFQGEFSKDKLLLPLSVFVFVGLNLALINSLSGKPFLLLERLIHGGGWVEVVFIAGYSSIVAWHMQDPLKIAIWRKKTWFLFSIVFFSQMVLGLTASPLFLMTGKLHLPIPAMILAGPVYRGDISVMTILFLSTVVLSGPAWCSHLCYFGGIDSYFAGGTKRLRGTIVNRSLKHTVLFLVICAALILKWTGASSYLALVMALVFGVASLGVILIFSHRKGKMVHCINICPIGTIVNYYKYVSPFRMIIDDTCSACMSCSSHCRYDALGKNDILRQKPGISCTLCGDCISSCHSGSLKYKFLNLSPKTSRTLYLFITVSLHAITLSMARI